MNLFLYRNNCKSSKQILDIFEIKNENRVKMVCLDEIGKKADYIIEKYKIRDIPCIITDAKILYSSEMFSFAKGTGEREQKGDDFFTGYNISAGTNMFSQHFSSISDEDLDTQHTFYNVEGISGPEVPQEQSSQNNKKSGKNKKSSEVDRRYEDLVAQRNNENKKNKKVHNDIPDFSKPFTKI